MEAEAGCRYWWSVRKPVRKRYADFGTEPRDGKALGGERQLLLDGGCIQSYRDPTVDVLRGLLPID